MSKLPSSGDYTSASSLCSAEVLPTEHDMHRELACGTLCYVEAECRQIEPGEHRFTSAQHDRRDCQVHLVDQSSRKILPHRGDAAADLDVFSADHGLCFL